MKFPNEALPCKAIWLNNKGDKDEYADFYPKIELLDKHHYVLRIVCDTYRAVYLDGNLISFGQYAHYPDTPVFDDISFVAKNNSELKISVWHSGIDSQTHVATKAYLAFCVFENGSLIYSSSADTLARPTPEYTPHLCKIITSQMGVGFSLNGNNSEEELSSAVEIDVEIKSIRPRPTKQLQLETPKNPTLIKNGYYRFCENRDSALMMKSAELDCDLASATGKYFLLDIGEECVGFPEIEYFTKKQAKAFIGWGEHITDGMCRCAIGTRRFTIDIDSRIGYNRYFPVLRRLGARYIQIFIEDVACELINFRFHPTVLPVNVRKKEFTGNNASVRKKIWETALHTLKCCMHEHYEDCPWREQALYTLDSRNQMLAGYKAFTDNNADFVRANLDLISYGVRQDGILALCYPAGLDYPIPFYTLAYFMQMDEYIQNTGDLSLAREKFDTLTLLIDGFLNKCNAECLIPRFPDSEGYWNFYEWSKYLSGDKIHKNTPKNELPTEANLNAALSIASRAMSNICKALGYKDKECYYSKKADSISKAVARAFYNNDKGYFFDFSDRPSLSPSVLTQALCILCGACDELDNSLILQAIAKNGGNIDSTDFIPATLSMACFRYDALLRVNAADFKRVILDEIDQTGKLMLDRNATTFWETLKGESDFGGAGSLCHGWSAMAIYYYETLI